LGSDDDFVDTWSLDSFLESEKYVIKQNANCTVGLHKTTWLIEHYRQGLSLLENFGDPKFV